MTFKYNPESREITADEKVIGAYDAEKKTVGLLAPMAPAHKGKLKKFLEGEGLEVEAFGTAEVEGSDNAGEGEGKGEGKGEGEGKGSGAVIPPCPARDPKMGDKTPAVVEWYRDHAPDEYARRYGKRRTHLSRIIAPKV